MTAKSEVRHLSPEELSPEELDAVSGGFIQLPLAAYKLASKGGETGGTGGGQNDPAQMFQQIMQQLTQG